MSNESQHQEWTPETVAELYNYNRIADAHNAELAAERQRYKHEREITDALVSKINRLSEQLLSAQHDAEVRKPLVDVLEWLSSELTCRKNETHYCPNCDNSLFNAKAKVDNELAKVKEGE